MNTNIIALLGIGGYLIIAAIFAGLWQRFEKTSIPEDFVLAAAWPIVIPLIIIGCILWAFYRIARGKKEEGE